MRRRRILAGLLLSFAAPLAAEAQGTRKVARVGIVAATSATAARPQVEALRGALRELGYIEGQNISIEERWAEGKARALR